MHAIKRPDPPPPLLPSILPFSSAHALHWQQRQGYFPILGCRVHKARGRQRGVPGSLSELVQSSGSMVPNPKLSLWETSSEAAAPSP